MENKIKEAFASGIVAFKAALEYFTYFSIMAFIVLMVYFFLSVYKIAMA